MASAIQGMDTIPREVAKLFGDLFTKYLPGWNINGIYNFQAGAAYQQAAGQLQLLMHNGDHPWINDTLKMMLADLQNNPAYAGKQTQYLSALVNFMYEANDGADGGLELHLRRRHDRPDLRRDLPDRPDGHSLR